MKKSYYVMQETETGEVFCAKCFGNEFAANTWIEENWQQFPESKFFVEYRP